MEAEPNWTKDRCVNALDNLLRVLSSECLEFLNAKPRKMLTEDMYSQLPAAWKDDLASITMEDIRTLSWLSIDHDDHVVVSPLHQSGLLNMGRAVQQYALSKQQQQRRHDDDVSTHVSLSKQQCVGMSLKKQHEVEHMASRAAHFTPPHLTLLDCGCGEGYLTCALSALYQRNVIGLEAVPRSGQNAQLLLRQMSGGGKKEADEENKEKGGEKKKIPAPQFRVAVLEDGTTVDEMRKSVSIDEREETAMIGLHCCGQLSVNVLRVFREDVHCVALCLVGCCYGRVGSMGHAMTFPLSKEAKKRTPHITQFGSVAFRAASDSPYLWRQKNAAEFDDSIRLMFYRIVSEQIMLQQYGTDKYECRKVTQKHCTSFPAYFRQLLRGAKLKSDHVIKMTDEELERVFREVYTEENAKRVALMLAIRVTLSSLIESVIVVDRIMYLLEGEVPLSLCRVSAAFDPNISPTNLILEVLK